MSRLSVIALVAPLVLLLAACGSGGAVSSAPASVPASVVASVPASAAASTGAACESSTDAPAVEVAIVDFAFDPESASAGVGDVVGWSNDDSAPHSAVFGDAGCGTETLASGDSGALVFTEAGTYEYVCGIHPAMKATIEISG